MFRRHWAVVMGLVVLVTLAVLLPYCSLLEKKTASGLAWTLAPPRYIDKIRINHPLRLKGRALFRVR
jgi:hypothetical protein